MEPRTRPVLWSTRNLYCCPAPGAAGCNAGAAEVERDPEIGRWGTVLSRDIVSEKDFFFLNEKMQMNCQFTVDYKTNI